MNDVKKYFKNINDTKNVLIEGESSLSLDIVRFENPSEHCLKLESKDFLDIGVYQFLF